MKENTLKLITGLFIIFSVNILAVEVDCSTAVECGLKGNALVDKGDQGSATKYFEKSCEFGLANTCLVAGAFYLNQGIDIEKGYDLIEKGCSLGDAKSCEILKQINSETEAQGITPFIEDCDKNDANSCGLVGMSYIIGERVEQDLQKAFVFLGKSCDLGSEKYCEKFKVLSKRILNTLKQKCDEGLEGACPRYESLKKEIEKQK